MDRPGLAHHLESSLAALRAHDLNLAHQHLTAALRCDFEDPRAIAALRCLRFWQERQGAVNSFPSNLEKCDYLLQQWAQFLRFAGQGPIGSPPGSGPPPLDDAVAHAFRHLVFGQAMNFLAVYNNEAGSRDPDVLWRMGVCLKGIGNYDAARRFLEEACALRRDSAAIMADLADACALVEESSLAKVLFREAFYRDPQAVRLETLESELIVRLVRSVRERYPANPELSEWIPVYGALHGVFSVKRELRALEYGKLRQEVFQLEREYQEGPTPRALLVPRLVNRYFWLLDHYQRQPGEQRQIQETLLKIRSLAPEVHEQYTK